MQNLMQGFGGGLGLGGFGGGPKPIAEFKAGKMSYDGKWVKPERRKGLVRLVNEGGAKKFEWCDLDSKNPIDSFYVFPGEVKFEKVKQSKDRVYLLEFTSTQQRHFYWMQDPDDSKDEENVKKLVDGLTNFRAGAGAGAGAGGRGGMRNRPGPQIQRNPAPRPGSSAPNVPGNTGTEGG